MNLLSETVRTLCLDPTQEVPVLEQTPRLESRRLLGEASRVTSLLVDGLILFQILLKHQLQILAVEGVSGLILSNFVFVGDRASKHDRLAVVSKNF
jgi:hypothetical protein